MSQLRADAIVDADGTGAPEFTNGLSSQGTIKLDGNYPVGSNNVALGDDAGSALSTGIKNTFLGSLAGDAITTGNNIVAVGYQALSYDQQGSGSVAIGNQALTTQRFTSATAAYNVAIRPNRIVVFSKSKTTT